MNSTPSSFWEWMNAVEPDERIAVFAVGVILGVFALVFVVTIVSGTIYKIHKNRLEDALKRELLERGMGAEEIVAVIRARSNKCGPWHTHDSKQKLEDA